MEPTEVTPLLPAAVSEGINATARHGTSDSTDSSSNDNSKDPSNPTSKDQEADPSSLKGLKFGVLFTCILLGDFFVGYDASCVAILAPVITDEFNALGDVGWYGTAYLLACCATILIYGQLYSFYSMKSVFISSFVIFILGTIVTATAVSSPAFILGRAISGLGCAGIFSGGNIILAHTTPLKDRPTYQAISGGVECVALSLGPVICGLLASATSWRSSFYIIIPFGLASLLAVFLLIPDLQRPENADLDNMEKFKRLDLVGFLVYVPMVVCLILALQWAGTELAWSDWRVIVLLTVTGVLGVAFLGIESREGKSNMFPLRKLTQRTAAFASCYTFCNSGALYVTAYYLPIYFEAVLSASPARSGLLYLPTAVSLGVSTIFAGSLTSYIGYYSPALIVGTILNVVSTALITAFFKPTTPLAQIIGFQILNGVGVGLAFQQPYIAVQTVLPEAEVPVALVSLSFTQTMGGIVALAVAQNIFLNRLAHGLAKNVPGVDTDVVLKKGVLDIIDAIPAEFREKAVLVFNDALVNVYCVALSLACLTIVGAFAIEWKSVRHEKKVGGEVQ